LPKKSLINMIWLLLIVSDRPIIMIGRSGLLLVISHLFAVWVLVVEMGLGTKKKKTWMWEIFLQGQILSTAGDAWECHVFHVFITHHFFFKFHCFFGSALQILLQFLFAAGGALGVYKESGGTNQLQLTEIV